MVECWRGPPHHGCITYFWWLMALWWSFVPGSGRSSLSAAVGGDIDINTAIVALRQSLIIKRCFHKKCTKWIQDNYKELWSPTIFRPKGPFTGLLYVRDRSKFAVGSLFAKFCFKKILMLQMAVEGAFGFKKVKTSYVCFSRTISDFNVRDALHCGSDFMKYHLRVLPQSLIITNWVLS